jgi:hypothetical protein
MGITALKLPWIPQFTRPRISPPCAPQIASLALPPTLTFTYVPANTAVHSPLQTNETSAAFQLRRQV